MSQPNAGKFENTGDKEIIVFIGEVAIRLNPGDTYKLPQKDGHTTILRVDHVPDPKDESAK